MTCLEGSRVKCEPCDDCGELFPPDALSDDYGLCAGCAGLR
jgi:hypothetical protein